MSNTIRRSRKGESMLVDFWAILIFAIICVVIWIIILASRSDNTQNIKEEFATKDVNLMLSSFLRAPYSGWNGKIMAEIIAEDTTTRDYTRTEAFFRNYFQGVDVYSDNPVGGYFFGINDNMIYFLNLENDKFIEQLGRSKLINAFWMPGGFIPIPVGMIQKTLAGENIQSMTHQEASTIIPGIDGQDIKVSIVIVYDDKYSTKYS